MQKNLRTRFALGTLAADARSAAAVVLLSSGLALMLAPGGARGSSRPAGIGRALIELRPRWSPLIVGAAARQSFGEPRAPDAS